MLDFMYRLNFALPYSPMAEDSGTAMGEAAASDPDQGMASSAALVPEAADPAEDSETSDRDSGSADR